MAKHISYINKNVPLKCLILHRKSPKNETGPAKLKAAKNMQMRCFQSDKVKFMEEYFLVGYWASPCREIHILPLCDISQQSELINQQPLLNWR